jgi:glycosyltransferase involved in cell wall biosynthesis
MRILLVNQFFYPDLAATSQILTDLAVDLAAKGERVSVVTGRGSYLGGGDLVPYEEHRGVRIHRVQGTRLGRGSIARRVADYGSFFATAAARVLTVEHPDLVITLSTPPLISLLGGLGSRARRTRFIYWVQDLYPDVAVAFGLLRPGSPATLAFEQLSRASLRLAHRVVAIGEVMGEKLQAKGLGADRLCVIHNWSDAAVGEVPREKNWFLDRHHLRGKFVVQYSGNMGRGHEFGTLLNAAEALRHRSEVAFLFIGEGAKRAEVEAAVRTRGLSNVTLLPYQRREDLPFSLGAADLSVTSLSDGLEGLIVPSKLYGVLAAGKPALHFGSGRSEVARVLAEERCGRSVAHGDAEGAVRFIEELVAHPEQAREMGARGRAAFLAKYDRSIATGRWHALCREVAGA